MIMFDMRADMEADKKLSQQDLLNLGVTELFLRGRKLDISLVFISQSYFKGPKTIRLNPTNNFVMKHQTKENSNKQHGIIRPILTSKIL